MHSFYEGDIKANLDFGEENRVRRGDFVNCRLCDKQSPMAQAYPIKKVVIHSIY